MLKKYWEKVVNEMINDKSLYELPTPRIIEMIEYYTQKRDYLLK